MYSKYREQNLKTRPTYNRVLDYRGFGLEEFYCMQIYIIANNGLHIGLLV